MSRAHGRVFRVSGIALLACLVFVVPLSEGAAGAPGRADAGGGASAKTALAGGRGHVSHHHYGTLNGGVRYDYLVYTPVGWRESKRLPLYVMVHGCGTTAEQQMQANRLNPIADRERFLVAYPDNAGNCWHAVSDDALFTAATGNPDITRGGGGDTDILAGMTTRVIRGYHADRTRVYMIGMSSGAFQTSATVSAYPELYAAAGVNAGPGPGMAVTCMGYPEATVPLYAGYGVTAMGRRAHVMPFFTIGGTKDPLGEQQIGAGGACSRLAHLEWLAINNRLAGTGTFRDDPASMRTGRVPHGYPWTKTVARGRNGCEVAERWIVEGMAHYWSGGTSNPKYAAFTDPKGPNASRLSWEFFKQFRLVHGKLECEPEAG